MESQSADAEPPPPPKPELRYPGLSRADTEGETHTYTHAQTSKPIQLDDLTVAHQLHCLKKAARFLVTIQPLQLVVFGFLALREQLVD